MTVKRMDNIGIVVADLAATIEFFRDLGLDLEGRALEEMQRILADRHAPYYEHEVMAA